MSIYNSQLETEYVQNGIKTDTFWLTVSNDGDFSFEINLPFLHFGIGLHQFIVYDEYDNVSIRPGGVIEFNGYYYNW